MSEEIVLSWLKFETMLKIFKVCMETARSAKEIANLVGKQATELAGDLATLQSYKILEFSEGKWKATSMAIAIYQKYFG